MPLAASIFHPFPLLAAELQQQIWSIIISAVPSRVVPLRRGPWVDFQPSDNPQSTLSHGGPIIYNTFDLRALTGVRVLRECNREYTSPALIPAPLHACSLSRSLALKRWRLSFGVEKGQRRAEGKVWFDFESDVLCFIQGGMPAFRSWVKVVPQRERGALRKIAFDFEEQLRSRNLRSGTGIANILMENFPMLSEVVMIGCERTAGRGLDEKEIGWSWMTFVENVDGTEEAFRTTLRTELDEFRDFYKEKGRQCPLLSYMDYTREDPELFKMVDKLDWLQVEY